ncbi:PAS domain-containing sensor histidine kinase [Flavilitoribacter nigricans]|uniref:histidine kinase n=1 Tax=Flavilitoribacter nigricans (strain ATCC 23147 / DSM 23189 / NBRC 102662 / NCIMB 1420 / SS-2) TaxID=1122177 RepID=A0A2D0N5X6_FLAN2|nr:PAS domain S-box protein [Flavilitoribacter nigricans]PHN03173.1 hypothetical protein CRP01_27650 [Flavilitoribacter nigricans DSM 23189 = NBRC 102662]
MKSQRQQFLSAALCRSVIDQAPDCIIIMDLEWCLLDANHKACNQLGYSLEEMLQLRFDEIEVGFTADKGKLYLQDLRNNGTPCFEGSKMKKDGTVFETETKLSFLQGDEQTFLLAFIRNISRAREAERKLQEEKLLVDALMESIPDSIYFKDLAARLIRVNQKLVRDIGATSDQELLGKNDIDLFGESFGQKTMAIDREIMRTGKPRIGLIERRELDDGNTNWTLTTKVPLFNPAGEIIGLAGISREINTIKEAEEKLRIKEYQLSMASKIAGLGYWEYDVEKNLYTFNDHFYEVYHTNAEEMGGYRMSAQKFSNLFLHEEDKNLIAGEIKIALDTPDPDFNKHLEHRIKYLNGETGYVSVNFFVVKNKEGKTIRTYGANQNITQRKLAEQAQQERETQLLMANKIAKLGYWEYDQTTNLLTVNDQFLLLHRTTAKEMGGYSFSPQTYVERFLLPDNMNIIQEEFAAAFYSRQSLDGYQRYREFRVFFENGEIGYLCSHYATIKDPDKGVYKTIGVNQDITERKLAELALKEKESNLQKAFEISAIGPYRYHIKGDQYEWSEQALHVIGFAPDQIPLDFRSFLDMMPEADRPILLQAVEQAAIKGKLDVEHRILIDGQTKWLRFKSHQEDDKDGEPLTSVGIVQDITERKLVEMELTSYREHLESLVKERTVQLENINKDLEAFAYSISHDLRGPLRHINGFANILRRKLIDPPKSAIEYIDLISNSSKRMGTMIDGLLHFSRLGRQQMTHSTVDLNRLVTEVIRTFKPDIERRRVRWNISALPTIQGDPDLLKIVFENLISNALKYTRNESEASIEINSLPNHEHNHCIYIKDNGVGFDMDYADNLFGVFQRLHKEEEFEGTGIGLAHAQQIVKKHGGSIRATAAPGKGATFYVIL